MTRTIFIQLAADHRDRVSLRATFLLGLDVVTASIWPILMGIAVLSKPVVYVLLGEKWLGAALPLSLLVTAQFIVLCFGMNWELFVLRGEMGRLVRFECIRAVVGVIGFAVGSLFGVATAAIGRIAEAVFGFALYRPYVSKFAEAQIGEIHRVYYRGAVLTFLAVIPSFVLMVVYDWSHAIPFWLLAAAVTLGVALWTSALIALSHPLCALFLSFIRPRTIQPPG
jgi:O-antigen/teichoic acid export membrane protein